MHSKKILFYELKFWERHTCFDKQTIKTFKQ